MEKDNPFKAAAILDPWMLAVQGVKSPTIPYLTIQSESFHWKSNLDHLIQVYEASTVDKEFAYIKQTAHNDVSDFSILFKPIFKMIKMAGDIHPLEHQEILHACILSFLKKHINFSAEYFLQLSATL